MSELSDDISIARLDILLRVKSDEILSLFGDRVPAAEKHLIRSDVEKTIFYYLSRRLLLRTTHLPIRLRYFDFLYYSALSFFNSSAGDIRPVSSVARIFTFIQVIGTFVILAIAVAFLNNVVANMHEFQISTIRNIMPPVLVFIGIALLTIIIASLIQRCIQYQSYNKILRNPENYGYTIRGDGTADLMINVNSLPESCNLGYCVLGMPFTAAVGEGSRYPGFVITKNSIRIAWAELLLPTNNRLYVYGEGFDIGEIGNRYKILIPTSIRAFSAQ